MAETTTGRSSKRSKTGCHTCRQRKVRCDEQHPNCGACCRLNLPCSFPSTSDKISQSGRSQRRGILKGHRINTTTSMLSSEAAGSPTLELTSGPRESACETELSTVTPWWSCMGEGLLDMNWLEHWIPAEDEHFRDFGQPALPPPNDNNDERHNGFGSVVLNRHVTILPQDREVLQHFTTTMVRFCILRNTVHDNLYTYILMNMGLFHSSLFDAIIAYSALHLAHIQQNSNENARKRYDQAYAALIEDLAHNIAPSLLLATIWFLIQYQLSLAEGVDEFCKLLNLAAEVARMELQHGDIEMALKRIGPVGSLVLVWMSARDSQAAYLGLGGKLLGCLKTYPHVYELVDASSVSEDVDAGPEIVFMEREQIFGRPKASDMQDCMRLSFRTVTVTGQIQLLGSNQEQHANSPAWKNIRKSLGMLLQEIEQDNSTAARAALGIATGSLDAMPLVNPIGYNRLLLLAAYYKTLINYHNRRPTAEDDLELLRPEECADRIIRLSRRASSGRPNSPQGIWPTHILIAAITTRDPIYQEWAVHAFRKAEKWGANYGKTRKLLETVIQRQNSTGQRADLVEVMKETTGLFIL